MCRDATNAPTGSQIINFIRSYITLNINFLKFKGHNSAKKQNQIQTRPKFLWHIHISK